MAQDVPLPNTQTVNTDLLTCTACTTHVTTAGRKCVSCARSLLSCAAHLSLAQFSSSSSGWGCINLEDWRGGAFGGGGGGFGGFGGGGGGYEELLQEDEEEEVDLYERLNLAPEASDRDIKSAYRKLSVQYHPDKNQGNKEAEMKFPRDHGGVRDPLRQGEARHLRLQRQRRAATRKKMGQDARAHLCGVPRRARLPEAKCSSATCVLGGGGQKQRGRTTADIELRRSRCRGACAVQALGRSRDGPARVRRRVEVAAAAARSSAGATWTSRSL